MDKGSSKFTAEYYPPLMTTEEEQAAYRKMEEGDPHVKELLVERNLRLVFYIARKYAKNEADFDDLMSVGSIGLLKAYEHFDVSKKVKFTTFASQCAKNEIRMYLRRMRKSNEISLEDAVKGRGGAAIRWEDIFGTQSDGIMEEMKWKEYLLIISEVIGSLPARDREMMKYRLGMNGHAEKTQKEVADMLGVSQSCVSKVEHKVMARMKKSMGFDLKKREKI